MVHARGLFDSDGVVREGAVVIVPGLVEHAPLLRVLHLRRTYKAVMYNYYMYLQVHTPSTTFTVQNTSTHQALSVEEHLVRGDPLLLEESLNRRAMLTL